VTAYTVVWGNTALKELTDLWMAAEDRASVTNATREIDLILSKEAAGQGVEIREGLMELKVKPLRVRFSVRELDRIVEAYKVVLR
jgi:hypothetical protein